MPPMARSRVASAHKPEAQSDKRGRFIHALAEFLVRDLGRRSIGLEMIEKGQSSSAFANEVLNWAHLYEQSGLFRYPTLEEAEQHLTALLAPPKRRRAAHA